MSSVQRFVEETELRSYYEKYIVLEDLGDSERSLVECERYYKLRDTKLGEISSKGRNLLQAVSRVGYLKVTVARGKDFA
jgi:hypothetical protein